MLAPMDPGQMIETANRAFSAQRLVEAESLYRRVIEHFPGIPEAHNNLGTVLKEQGRLIQARAAFERALALRPSYAAAHSNLLFTLQYSADHSPAKLRAAHVEWARRYSAGPLQALPPMWAQPASAAADAVADIRPRAIGIVSPDLRLHPVGIFVQAWLEHRDRFKMKVVAYSDYPKADSQSHLLRGFVDLWHDTAGLDDEALAQRIRSDGIDILLDLAGHTAGNRLRLFGRRLAPVQVSWLGYSATTGLPTMDAVLFDENSAPPEIDSHFVEKVVRLKAPRLCYTPPSYAPKVASLPALARGSITFGSFNNLAKLTPEVIETWCQILAAVPNARLMLKWRSLGDPETRARVIAAFGRAGLGADRLEIRGWSRHAEMLAEYSQVDIGLDPFPFSGGLTSCDALYMGVPILTLPGAMPISRQTAGFMTALGLGEWIVPDRAAYVAAAAALARQLEALSTLRRSLRETMLASPLCNARAHARAVDEALLALIET